VGEAEMMYQQVLERHEKGCGIEHPWTLNTAYNLGDVHVEHDQLVAAEALYQLAREGNEKVFGPEDPNTVCAVKSLRKLSRHTQEKNERNDGVYFHDSRIKPRPAKMISTIHQQHSLDSSSERQLRDCSTRMKPEPNTPAVRYGW
jgi:hypothetical protein